MSEIIVVVGEERRFDAGGTRLSLGYQVLDGSEVLEEGQFTGTVEVDTPLYWERARAGLMRKVEEVLVRTRTRNVARVALGGRSIMEVAPVLDGWRVRPASGVNRFTLHHPVDDQEFHLFIFNEEQMAPDSLPTHKAQLEKLEGKCLGGVLCTAVTGAQAGELTVGIEGPVAGAVEYRWYGRYPGAGWPTALWEELANGTGGDVDVVGVAAGYWEVRCCALGGDGVLGLLGAGVEVSVSG